MPQQRWTPEAHIGAKVRYVRGVLPGAFREESCGVQRYVRPRHTAALRVDYIIIPLNIFYPSTKHERLTEKVRRLCFVEYL